MELGLSEKVALITGGSDGLGKATAIAMGHEGVNVAICARNPERLERAADDIRGLTGGQVLAVPADVRNQEQIERLFEQTLHRFGRLDILVNNAGGSAAGPLLENGRFHLAGRSRYKTIRGAQVLAARYTPYD